MITALTLAAVTALFAPRAPGADNDASNCPSDVGHIRWNGVQYAFSGPGGAYRIEGRLWDRDRDGKPSNGDLMKIEEALHKGQPMSMNPTWVTLKGGLARDLAAAFKRSPPTSSVCESHFEVQDVPVLANDEALALRLRALSGFAVVSPEDAARADLNTWAGDICRTKTHNIKRADLNNRLMTRARHSHKRLGNRVLKTLVDETTAAFAMECGQLDVQKRLTFE